MKSPIKLFKAKQFDYQPMYYDAEKERMEARKSRIAKELALENKTISNEALSMRLKFERNHVNRKSARSEKWSSIRLIVILLILIVLFSQMFIDLDRFF